MTTTVHYRCAGRTVEVTDESLTILDVSIANKIPHWRECGGHGQCTTCRVRVVDGLANLSERTESERALAESRGWGPSIRLACQTRPRGDVTLERVIRRGADASQIQLETVSPKTGEERMLAMLFCDMRDFTNFAETHSAFDVVHILNRLFAALGEPILLNGGVIYQYVGDEISGLFGLDHANAERACRASVRAALGMLDALDQLNKSLLDEFGVQITIGIGVHYGPAIVGEVGHPARRQFSVVGDHVNMASRIQAMNKSFGTNLLVSDSVIDHLPANTLTIEKATSAQLRGKQEIVHLQAVNGFAELDHFLLVQRTMSPLLDGTSKFASKLYERLFRAAPELEKLFVNGVEAQGQMLEYMVRGVIFGLGRSNHLSLGLQDLGNKHTHYGVEPRHYDVFRKAMLDTIEEILGEKAYTPQLADAWSTTIDMMLSLMKRGTGEDHTHPS